jgi:nitroimidazol reductase NimA-like FMN-containing flavoprotein (pyridoxamine 5'-phosphate oxidase superfamily)
MLWSMNREEREYFLAGVHVGVLSVGLADRPGTLAVPVWYSYQPGGTVGVITGRDTRKASAIRAAGRFGLCAQDERPPYKYVTVEGPAVVQEVSHAERVDLAHRYLGAEDGDAYIAANPDGTQIVFRMTPEQWLTVDFSKVYG